ncbi:hypothetical protein [Cysteiniphilum litorale]|uniref:hypothetical protein n=1 Tax=Cysteiniphilum litorale TaxID=2056700 RepID=UPI003F885BF1
MANKHRKPTFEALITSRYQRSVTAVLKEFQRQQYTHAKVALVTGFTQSTIRRYCRKHNIVLYPELLKINICPYAEIRKHIQSDVLSSYNALYRSWRGSSLTTIIH